MSLKNRGLASSSASKAEIFTTLVLVQALWYVLVRIGQWSFESSTVKAIVPVTVLLGTSKQKAQPPYVIIPSPVFESSIR